MFGSSLYMNFNVNLNFVKAWGLCSASTSMIEACCGEERILVLFQVNIHGMHLGSF